tara:strand:- start:2666 stop:3439 length:774 start_codon:yes stop_codon:yes gene_type:complete
MIIDSHCHLDYPELYNNIDQVIKRAEDNKVKYLLSICTTLESFEKIKKIISKYKNVYGTFGIHPHETKKFIHIDKNYILNLKKKYIKIIGIGETGLDFYYNHSDKIDQKKCFVEHIQAASELNIPLIVHSRNAENETLDIIKSEKKNSNIKILMHCFTGSKDFAKKLLDLDCYISVSGIITFNKSESLSDTISLIPINRLMVETDSPYLSPVPHRGKSNEPSYIIHTVKKLSEIKKIDVSNIMKNTSDNFLKLFNIS